MLSYEKDKWEVVHPKRRVEQTIRINEENDVFDSFFNEILVDIYYREMSLVQCDEARGLARLAFQTMK